MLTKENIKNIYTLSPMQAGMFFHALYDKSSYAYFEQVSYHLKGELNLDFVKQSLNELFKRYDILRTVFVQKKAEKILQIVLKEREVDFLYEDISAEADKDSYLQNFKEMDKEKSFDISKDVLMRVAVIKTGAKEHEFIWSHHHILMDGWCLGILNSEFFEIYTALLGNRPYKLGPVTPYKNYIEWLENRDMESSKRYWSAYLENYEEAVGIPRRKMAGDEKSGFKSEKVVVREGPDRTGRLTSLAVAEQVTMSTIIQAVWGFVLSKYNGREDVVFGAVVSGRPGEIENVDTMVGLFINTVPVRIRYENEKTFGQILQKVQKDFIQSEPHHYFPLNDIQSTSTLKQNLLDHIVVFQNYPVAEQIASVSSETGANRKSASFKVTDVESFEQTNYNFMLMARAGERLSLRFDYNGYVNEKDLIERLAGHFMRVLEQVSVDGKIKTGDIRFISEEEQKQLIYEFNDTAVEFPRDMSIHRLFTEQVERTPENIAIIGREQVESEAEVGASISLKYREFKQRCEHFASFLIEKGVQPGSIIGIMAHRSVEMVVGIFAILSVGGAYLPIDPLYPFDRKEYLLRDSGAKLLLTTRRLYEDEKLSSLKVETIFIDEVANGEGISPGRGIRPPLSLSSIQAHNSSDLCYVIYTSGSTGKPKGVMVEQHSVVNLLYTLQDLYPLRESDTYLFKTSYLFDVSVAELFGWFTEGGKLAVLVKGGEREPETILAAIAEAGVTHINFVPSMFSVFIDELNPGNKNKLSGLKYIFLAGEALLPGQVKKFRELNTGIVLENIYGPTEATVYACKYSLSQWDGRGNIPIGRPLANMSNYILNRDGFLQPLYIQGELYIAGAGVARGYLNNPELTGERFIDFDGKQLQLPTSNFQLPNFQLIYRTGDLVCRMPDGNIDFSGRMDSQVKVRGFRIELGEIENCLRAQRGIEEAVVLAKERIGGEKGSDKYLCAYIVSDSELSILGLRDALAQRLPEYMIPTYFFPIEKIPLTGSGKIDRRALPDPDESLIGDVVEYAAPRTVVEKILVETWGRLLIREKPGIHENFFMIGGDSIKSIQIASAMKIVGYRVEVRDIFRNPTIAGLAPHVRKVTRQPAQGDITGVVLLTPIQKRFFEIVGKENHHYNQSVMLQSKKGFSADILRDVFTKIQEHHDALRMTYRREKDRVIQTGHGRDYPLSLTVFDFRDRTDAVEQLKKEAEKIQASIDLERGPMMKVALFHLAEGDRLLIVIHHLVIDGVSWRILFEDIETLYRQRKQGESFSLPLKSDSFKLWAERLAEYADNESFLLEKNYWANLEATEIPPIRKDFETAAGMLKQSAQLSFTLNPEETELLLNRVNAAFGTEINDILLTALALAFKQTFSEDRVLVGLEGHGREEILQDMDVNRAIGWFTSLYPVVLDASYCENLSCQVKEIKESLRRLPNKGIGYGILKYLTAEENKQDLVFKLDPRISFNYLGQFGKEVETKTFAVAQESTGSNRSAKGEREFDLDVSGMISGDRLSMAIVYDSRQFKVETMESLLDNYKTALCRVIEFCSGRQERELTPSDLTYKELSIEILDRLRSQYSNLKDIYRLTPMQEGMLFHALYGEETVQKKSTAYFEQMSYRFLGDLNVSLVEKSLNILFERHDILRTAFVYEDVDRPLQVVLRDRKVDFHYEDLSATGSLQEREAHVKEFKEQDRKRYFNLTQDVLLRTAILRVDKSEYEFTWSFFHILMDGWCVGILNSEFFEIYSSYLENREVRLPPVKPYREYIRWLEKQDKETSRDYWARYLQSYDESAVIPRIKAQEKEKRAFKSDHITRVLEREESIRLKTLAGSNRVTLNTVFQALWGIILGRYSGKKDVVFGTVVSGRPAEIGGVESMVGLFINTIPVRIKYEVDTRFTDFIQIIREEAIGSEAHHYYPLADIQSASPLKQNLLDHLFVFENFPIAGRIESLGGDSAESVVGKKIKLVNVDVFEQTNYDFYLTVTPGEELVLRFDFNANVYPREYMAGILTHLEHVMRQVLKNKLMVIDELSLLSEEEKRHILYDFNDTKTKYPKHKVIHRLFEEQAESQPGKTALVLGSATDEETSLTYRELNERANQLAAVLRSKGVSADQIVGLMSERSLEMIIGIFAILKAGGAYLPIAKEFPGERVKYMLSDCNVAILLVSQRFSGKVEFGGQLINLNDPGIFRGAAANLRNINQAEDVVYIIYTSGSTGKPKGILTKHTNVIRVIKDTNYINITPADALLQLSSYAFDGSTFDIFGALLNGAKLVLIDEETVVDIEKLADIIKQQEVSVFFVTTALFNTLIDTSSESLTKVRKILFGGERISVPHAVRAVEILGRNKIIHVYGPTESTVFAASFPIDEVSTEETNLPIGKPIANTKLYVLDENLNPVPTGAAGELFISGEGLARGYLNSPDLTVEKFIANPFITGEQEGSPEDRLMYRTGDLVRMLPDGNILFLDRVDFQVKLRGFRIELGEIESKLRNHKQIKDAVVLAREEKNGGKYLTAYIESYSELPVSDLREFLMQELPDYMAPAYFVFLEEFPLTSNGKIDRKALPVPEKAGADPDTRYQAPSNEVEESLADTWEKVLGREKIGVHENFFMIGGDSIKSIQINSRLRKLGYKVEMKDIFGFPTIAELASRVKKIEQTVDQSPVSGIVPLTPIQREFFREHHTTAAHFNQSVMLVSKERLTVEAVRAVFLKLQEHHDALRMTFEENNGQFAQKNNGLDFPVSIKEYDLTNRQNGAAKLGSRANEIQASIDLSAGPLVKVGLFHLKDGDRLLIVIHHLVIDGVSWRILFEDIETLFRQQKNEEPFNLPLKTHSFQFWAERLSRYANSEHLLNEKNFWAGFESVEFPLIPKDFPGEDNLIKDAEKKSFSLSPEDTALLLSKVNKPFNTEINDILLTALGLTVRETYGHERVLLALEGHGREEILENVDINRTVGWFTAVYPVLLDLSMADDLSRQIKEIKESLRKIPGKGVGYGILKFMTAPENKQDLTFNMKPQISFNYLGQFDSDINRTSFTMAAESRGRSVDQEMRVDYDLVVIGILARQTLNLSIQYSKKQFKAEKIEFFIDNFHKKLKHIITHCVSREVKEITPSDLTYDGLSIDTMESLGAMFDD